jgi:predicted metalloprotease
MESSCSRFDYGAACHHCRRGHGHGRPDCTAGRDPSTAETGSPGEPVPEDPFGENSKPKRAQATLSSAASGTDQHAAAAAYLEIVLKDADVMWTQIMTNGGFQQPAFGYKMLMPGEVVASNCSPGQVSGDEDNAYYCSQDMLIEGYDGTVYLPVNAFLEMWGGDIFNTQAKTAGDFTAAIIAVHEVGHEIVQEVAEQTPGAYLPGWKYAELLPDCFAGVWLQRQYYQGMSQTQLDQALNALEAIGDYDTTNSQHHGTPEERREAVETGYNTDARVCSNAFWKYTQ